MFIFAFVSLGLETDPKKYCYSFCESVLPIFSSRNLMDSLSYIYMFIFIFICCIRQSYSFSCSCTVFPVSLEQNSSLYYSCLCHYRFSSVAQLCLTLYNPKDSSNARLPCPSPTLRA